MNKTYYVVVNVRREPSRIDGAIDEVFTQTVDGVKYVALFPDDALANSRPATDDEIAHGIDVTEGTVD